MVSALLGKILKYSQTLGKEDVLTAILASMFDYSNDFKKLHKIKIILTESNLAWATYEDEIKNNL